MSKVTNLAPLHEKTMFMSSFMRSREMVLVPTSPGYVMFWPAMVIQVRLGEVLSGRNVQTTLENAIPLWRLGGMSPLDLPEYVRIKLSEIPAEFINEYNLMDYVHANGWVYFKIFNGIYGLLQSGSLANISSTNVSRSKATTSAPPLLACGAMNGTLLCFACLLMTLVSNMLRNPTLSISRLYSKSTTRSLIIGK